MNQSTRRILGPLPIFTAFAAVLIAAIWVPATALAHPGHQHIAPGANTGSADQPEGFRQVGNLKYRYLPGRDEFEVHRPGLPPGFLHPDYLPGRGEAKGSPAASPQGGHIALPGNELDPVCRTSGNRTVVVFTHRPGDSTPTPTATLRSVVKRMNWKINDQSSQSSGGSRAVRMAVDCNGEGQINVYNVATSSNKWANLIVEVKNALFLWPSGVSAVKYLVFDNSASEEGSYGGLGGPIWNMSVKSNGNPNGSESSTGLVFPCCWELHTTIHELFHAMGASQGTVSPAAPFSTNGHHCTDGIDMLCYDDGGGYSDSYCPESSGYATPTTVPIDCNKNTYFDALPEPGSWLDTYWNLAERENWFLVAPPKATTEEATAVKGKSAFLRGTIDAEGTQTSYYFQYGKTISYGSKTATTSIFFGGGASGEEPVKVENQPKGLTTGTTYHYRAVAVNIDGTTIYGADKTFTTLSTKAPAATTEGASGISKSEATLSATVNPDTANTLYQFEYGKTTGYGKVLPAYTAEDFEWIYYHPEQKLLEEYYEELLLTPGAGNVKVSQKITGLEPHVTYHYRIKATNEAGVTYGSDQTFTTHPDVKPPTFSFAFGSAGSGNGQFNDLLLGITVDSEGNVWVADRANSRVQKFNSKGEYLMQFGTKGTGNGQFRYPQGLDIDSSSNVWVVDKLNNRVQKFNSKGEYLSQFGGSGSGNGQFASPEGLDIDSSGNVWVVDRGNNRVQKFNSKGEYLSQFGKAGAGEGQLSGAMDLAVDSAGEIWVAENGNDRVQHFSADGKYISKFGSAGSADGQFQSPMGIDVDAEGNLWITDLESDRVQAFYPEGDFLTKFGTEGSGEGQFKGAGGVAIDAKGSLWVTDRDNDRVQKWVPSAPYPVITGAASSITRFKGTLNGSINPEGKATSYYFEYGTTSAYGAKVPLSAKSIGSGSSPVKVSEALSNLKAGTTYHYRVVATTEKGTTYGENRNFKTLAGAGPEAQWRLNGKTLTELGVKEATLVSSGTFTIEIPSSSITVSCTESGSGKISGTNGLEREVTLNCKLLKFEAQCTYSPTFIFFTGTGTELHPTGKELILKTSGECPWGKMTTLGLPANFAHEVGTESKQVQTAIYATGSYGAWNAYYTGYSTWELTGAQAGKTLGLW